MTVSNLSIDTGPHNILIMSVKSHKMSLHALKIGAAAQLALEEQCQFF
jgi:hypothetical protein